MKVKYVLPLALLGAVVATSGCTQVGATAQRVVDRTCALTPEARALLRAEVDAATSASNNYVRVYCGELPADLVRDD